MALLWNASYGVLHRRPCRRRHRDHQGRRDAFGRSRKKELRDVAHVVELGREKDLCVVGPEIGNDGGVAEILDMGHQSLREALPLRQHSHFR